MAQSEENLSTRISRRPESGRSRLDPDLPTSRADLLRDEVKQLRLSRVVWRCLVFGWIVFQTIIFFAMERRMVQWLWFFAVPLVMCSFWFLENIKAYYNQKILEHYTPYRSRSKVDQNDNDYINLRVSYHSSLKMLEVYFLIEPAAWAVIAIWMCHWFSAEAPLK
jgi:hypothetical protein